MTMPTNLIPDAMPLIPILASAADSDTLVSENWFNIQERKQNFLRMLPTVGVTPLNVTAGSVEFWRQDLGPVVVLMGQLGLKPLPTVDASYSSVRTLSGVFGTEANYAGEVQIDLCGGPSGFVHSGTTVQLQILDDADAVKLVRSFREAVASLDGPVSLTTYGDGQVVADKAKVEAFQKTFTDRLMADANFKEALVYRSKPLNPGGLEVSKAFSTTMALRFPDSRVVKVPIGSQKAAGVGPATGHTWVGPDPKFLPLVAGSVLYKLVEVSPDEVRFTVSTRGKSLHADTFSLPLEQFQDLSAFWQIQAARSVESKDKAAGFNVGQRSEMKREREQSDLDQKVLPASPLRPGDKLSDDSVLSTPPKLTKLNPLSKPRDNPVTAKLGIW